MYGAMQAAIRGGDPGMDEEGEQEWKQDGGAGPAR
jgi:hypothetical protein